MLFAARFHEPIRTGQVTVTFRRWKAPQAKVGGQYRLHSGGVIEATSVVVVHPTEITEDDARRSGFESVRQLRISLSRFQGELYRVDFRYLGDLPDERVLLAADDELTDEARADIQARLARMDGGARGPWTHAVLRLIATNEGVRAADLARKLDRETLRFKGDVRRLKALGLTESLETGYRLSPRGHALIAASEGDTEARTGAASENEA